MGELTPLARSDLSQLLERLRRDRGWPKRTLAEKADISPTYMGQIESSIDPRTGKPYQPSAAVLLRLAQALSEDRPRETDGIYRELMEAAGYTPVKGSGVRSSSLQPAVPQDRVEAVPVELAGSTETLGLGPAAPAAARARALPRDGDAPTPRTPDPRMERHLLPLLQRWEELTSSEQAALLEFAEFLDGKRRGRRRTNV